MFPGWVDLTCGDFKRRLAQGTPEERAYWLGALMREANTRDVYRNELAERLRRRALAGGE